MLYLRDYPTFIKLGLQFGISESSANQIYHKMSTLLVKILPVKNRQTLVEENIKTLVVDVTEQPLERPQRVYCENGHVHDFKIFKDSQGLIPPTTTLLADSGYQTMVLL